MNSIGLQSEIREKRYRNVYLFIATDEHIANSYIDLLISRLVGENLAELNLNKFTDKGTNIDQVVEILSTLPIMADRRVVLIKNEDAVKKESNVNKLLSYLKNPLDTSTLIIYVKEMDKRKALYKRVNELHGVVECSRLRYYELKDYLLKKLKEKNLSMSKDTLEYFIEASDYLTRDSQIDLGYFANELDKLAMHQKENKKVSIETIKKVCSFNVHDDIFKLCDCLNISDLANAYKQLYRLEYNKVPFPVIFGAVARHLRQIAIVQTAYSNNRTEEQIAKDFPIHPFVIKKIIGLGNKFRTEDALSSIRLLANLDYSIKMGCIDEKYALHLLITQICEKSFSLLEVGDD